jgi:sulfatase modifying factor 1
MKSHILIPVLFFSISLNAQTAPPKTRVKFALPEMAVVDSGTFRMGRMDGESNEKPQHAVTLKGFSIAKYETTQTLWQQVMGDTPSAHKNCMSCPVESVSPERIDSFISKLNKLSGLHYRLPTEAEWEYAAQGGNKSKHTRYPGSNDLGEVAWYKNNAGDTTHQVGTKKPNELGLYDMSGNVWEYCSDWFDSTFYKRSPALNPINGKKAIFKVMRGGSWRSGEERCYTTARNRNAPDHYKFGNGGFRLVLDK